MAPGADAGVEDWISAHSPRGLCGRTADPGGAVAAQTPKRDSVFSIGPSTIHAHSGCSQLSKYLTTSLRNSSKASIRRVFSHIEIFLYEFIVVSRSTLASSQLRKMAHQNHSCHTLGEDPRPRGLRFRSRKTCGWGPLPSV